MRSDHPPSLYEFAKREGVSERSLREIRPDESARLVAAAQVARERAADETVEAVRAAYEAAAIKLHLNGKASNRKTVQAEATTLPSTTGRAVGTSHCVKSFRSSGRRYPNVEQFEGNLII